MRVLKICAFGIFLMAIIGFFVRFKPQYHLINGEIFGTYYTIKIRTSTKDSHLEQAINDELAKINAQMSVFDTSSEISKINNTEANLWIDLSENMQLVLKNAHLIYKLSDGAYDPTAGKLIDLWGFGVKGKIDKLPTDDEISEILEVTGFDKIQFSEDYSKLKKLHSEVVLNLSSIAKGFGVDRIAQLLKSKGYNDFIVEIGGEVVSSGKKSDKVKGWNVGVVMPNETSNENAFVVTLKDYAVATSGDYRNFFYVKDKKYSHTIDTKTGYPTANNILSVTVFNESCMFADGIATAIMSLGEEKGLALAKNNDLAIIMFVKTENNQIINIVSPKAKKLIEK